MITSTRNDRVAAAAKLNRAKSRRNRGQFLLEGPNLIDAGLKAGVEFVSVFAVEESDRTARLAGVGAEVLLAAEQVLRKISDTENPRGPIAVAKLPDAPRLAAMDTVVLVGVSDPGNAGTLIRSAAAFVFQVAVTKDSVDVWSPKVLRAGAGAHFLVNVVAPATTEQVHQAGITLAALLPRDDGRPDPNPEAGPVALLVGNEAQGLPKKVIAAATTSLTIPTVNVESLNAAVAGSIAMFAVAQGR